MRIAFSGAHRTGKSTLLERVAETLPGHTMVDEPYHLLEEDGYETPEVPALDDFVAQLERSLEALEEGGQNVLFDRCPADILAYLFAHEDGTDFDADEWLERTGEVMQTLDLVVFVPIEEPDCIAVAAHEGRRLRRDVHAKLEELLVENLAWDVDVLRVEGDLSKRVEQVKARIAELR